jgi:hypothetical protein
MSQEKTLVVILCMHRSGSSLAARLLERLGMSLGPFDLGEINESNKYGHYEAQPFVLLNREFQLREFGFEGDLPETREALDRFCACDGRFSTEDAFSGEAVARGRELVERLMQSGPICGFKDPRTALVWPYWRRVFAAMPGLRIVPLFVVRGPHEIAMSIFRRSHGLRGYFQALETTAVHFRRMKEILDRWPAASAVAQFDPLVCRGQLQRAAELCGLNWSDEAFAEVYDTSCRHHEVAVVDHPAQAAFEALLGAQEVTATPSSENALRLLADAAAREATLHHYRESYDSIRQARDVAQREVDGLWNYVAALKEDSAALRRITATIPPLEARLAQTNYELSLIQNSKTWRAREALVHVFRFGRQAATHQETTGQPSCGGENQSSTSAGMHYQERKDRADT